MSADLKCIKIIQSYEGFIFTMMFFIMFTVTNLMMIDFLDIRETVSSQNPLIIIILSIILAYLMKNSKMKITKIKIMFLILWGLYVLSVFVSMTVHQDFFVDEIIIFLMISMMFLYQFKPDLLVYIITGALFSLPFLMLSDITLNESGATMALVVTAGFLIIPKTNRALLLYLLPATALMLTVTNSRTALIVYGLVVLIYFAYINLAVNDKKKGIRYLGILGGFLLLCAAVFFRPLYHFFTVESISSDGVDLNELTSTRFNVWLEVIEARSWFGSGVSYLDFSMLWHAHNIFVDTLGRYGIFTVLLFTAVLLFSLAAAFFLIKTPVVGLYISAFILIGLMEYNYLFLFDYCVPIILFFSFVSIMVSQTGDKESLNVG